MSDGIPFQVPPEVIRAELDRILVSPAFEASERNRRFLRHVVDETLAGRADRIKAYSIATGVFGRKDDFDPQQDSIVRIEAGRLRRALDYFYLKEGAAARVRISVPKGTYVPEFLPSRQAGEPAAAPRVTTRKERLHELGPRILVENIDQNGDIAGFPTIGRTFTRQIITALAQFTELFVYGIDTSDAFVARDQRPDKTGGIAVDYRLLGTVTVSSERLQAELLLCKAGDRRFVWAQSFERGLGEACDPARIVRLCAEIAGHAAGVVALRDGILDSQARDSGGDAPKHFAGYQKLLDFQDYWRSLDPGLFEPLRKDLETTIAQDPRFADAHACLSMLYSNAARYGYDVSAVCSDPLGRAIDLARTAIQLAPNSSRAHHARAVAEWFSGLPDESLATLQIARSLNPHDPELLAEYGFRSAMRMDWERAVPLLEEAYIRNPLQTGQYRMGLCLYHYAEGRYEKTIQEARAIDAPGISYVHLIAAAALSRLGRMEEARKRLHEVSRLAPGLQGRLRVDLAFRQIHPELIASISAAVETIDPNWAPQLSLRGNRRQ